MEIILLEKILNLGELGDKVRVKAGYARNYLVPQGRAVPATAKNIAEFEARRAELERQQEEALAEARARADALADLELVITQKAGDAGRLFGSVGTVDIAEALTAAGHEVTRSEVRLPGDAIRQTGEYEIGLHLHAGLETTIKLKVEPEG